MNNRSWLRLFLILSPLLLPLQASAQLIRIQGLLEPPRKQSHHALTDEPDLQAGPEMMAERLRELQELHRLQDRMQDLLHDPDFQKNLRNNFTDEQLRQLREKIVHGDRLNGDRDWNRLLDQAVSRHKLDSKEIDILRRWAERSPNKPSNPMADQGTLSGRAQSTSNASTSASSSSHPNAILTNREPSFWDRLQGDTSEWIARHVEGLAGDVLDAMEDMGAGEEGAPLAELMRSIRNADLAPGSLGEDGAGMANYLPDLSGSLPETGGFWDELGSIFREMQGPSMPGVGSAPSLPSAATADGESWGGGLAALLTLVVLLMLLWKMGGWARLRRAGSEADSWRLGPWPVAPAAVTTRRDLVLAFEHLALLALGPQAGTHHHRDLAERLAQQGAGGPARRQAAELLAWLYEQARYAPEDEAISPDQLAEARQALRFLAGVTTA